MKSKGTILFIVACLLFFVIEGCTVQPAVTTSGDVVTDGKASVDGNTDVSEDQGDSDDDNDDEENSTDVKDKNANSQDGKGIELGDKNNVSPEDGQEEQDSTEQEDSNTENPENQNIVYISASRLNVRQEPLGNASKIGELMKGTGVIVLDANAGQDQKEWLKISFDSGKEEITGWVAAEYTVKDREELLDEEFRKLDYSPQNKVEEYVDNPRVKVRGVYLTIYSASGSRLDSLIEMAKRTDINTFVIDVKDDNGHMLFPTEAAEKFAPAANKNAPIEDISTIMKKLKDNNIHTIARIVTFKDPIYTEAYPDRAIIDKRTGKPHTNNDGLRWASPHDRQLWEYDVSVAKKAAEAGFNEIQFDYVRFPASNGGKLDSLLDYRNTQNETKPRTIQDFLKYAYEELSPYHVYVGADVYGLVGSVTDDMGLGQYWEAVSNVVDYICPMMYPSHYANRTYGLPVPDAYPYETLYHSTKDSALRNRNIETPAIIRPWIQDFTASWVKGHIKYGEKEVRAQIEAMKQIGVDEFMLWNPNNKYTEAAVTN